MLRRTSPAKLRTYTANATTVVVTNTSAASTPGGKGGTGTGGTRRGSGFTATVTTKSKKPNKAATAAAQQKKKKNSVNVQHISEHDSAAKEEPLSCIVPIVSGPDLIRPSGKSNSVWSVDNEEGTRMPPAAAAAGAAFLSSTDLAFRFAPTRNFGIRSVNTNAHARIDDGSGVSDTATFSLTSSSSWDNTIQERLWIQVLYTNPNTNTTHDSSQSTINNYTVVNAIELPSVGVHLTASPGGDRIGVVLADGSVLCYDIISFYDDDAADDDDDDQGQVVVSILPRWSVPFMVSPTKMEAAASSLYIAPIRTFEFSSCSDHILLVDAQTGQCYLLDATACPNDIDARIEEHRHTEIYMFPNVAVQTVVIDTLHPYKNNRGPENQTQNITSACWSPSITSSRSKQKDLHIAVGYASSASSAAATPVTRNKNNTERIVGDSNDVVSLGGTIRIFDIHMWEKQPKFRLLAALTPPKIIENNSPLSSSSSSISISRGKEEVIEPWQCTQVTWLQPKKGNSILFVGYGTQKKLTVDDSGENGSSVVGPSNNATASDTDDATALNGITTNLSNQLLLGDGNDDMEDDDDDDDDSERFQTAFFSTKLPDELIIIKDEDDVAAADDASYSNNKEKMDDDDNGEHRIVSSKQTQLPSLVAEEEEEEEEERLINVDWSENMSSPSSLARNGDDIEDDDQHYFSVAVPCSENLDVCRSPRTNSRLENIASALNKKYSSPSSKALLSLDSSLKKSLSFRMDNLDDDELNKRVHFAGIEIREYESVIGDNPSVRLGPPVSLGWSFIVTQEMTTDPLPFDCHDDCNKKADKGIRFLNKDARIARLREFGFSDAEIEAASSEVQTTQLDRAESMKEDQDRMYFKNLGRRIFKVIDMVGESRRAPLLQQHGAKQQAFKSYNSGSHVGRAL